MQKKNSKISKLKVIYKDGEITIEGNKEGLRFLAEVCHGLSDISNRQAKTPTNHYHIADYMNNAEEGSIPTIILYKADL